MSKLIKESELSRADGEILLFFFCELYICIRAQSNLFPKGDVSIISFSSHAGNWILIIDLYGLGGIIDVVAISKSNFSSKMMNEKWICYAWYNFV